MPCAYPAAKSPGWNERPAHDIPRLRNHNVVASQAAATAAQGSSRRRSARCVSLPSLGGASQHAHAASASGRGRADSLLNTASR